MRPRYLEIEGLQSFKEIQRIDFDHLSETGLFGIFGPTGSGKSTVLDAITLALYGKVHRVNGTQGIINTNLKGLKVSFTFDILKGKIRKTYRVERVYNRKKDSENSCEVKIARLVEVLESGEVPIVDKHGEVSAKVEELLGLKHDDFTRAVVLPQNKFQEFLLMNNSDKSKMLERIFYLEEYGKLLSDKVAKKYNSTMYQLTEVKGALSQLGDASDKALDEEYKNMQFEEANKEKVINEMKGTESKFNEAKEVWQLTCELDSVTQREQMHLVRLQEINDKKSISDKASKADNLIDLIKKFKDTEKLLSETNVQMDSVLLKLPIVQKEFNDAHQKYEATVKESKDETPKLVEKKTRLYSALDIKKEIEGINAGLITLRETFLSNKEKIGEKDKQVENASGDIKSSEENILKLKEQLAGLRVDIEYKNEIQKGIKLEDELITAKLNRETHQATAEGIATRIDELQKSLNLVSEQVQAAKKNMHSLVLEKSELEKSKPGNRDELTAAIERYHTLKSLIALIKNKDGIVEALRTKTENARENLEKYKSNLNNLEKAREISETEKNTCLIEVESFKKLIEKNTAYMLARNLKDGTPCPVCGSQNHPSLATESVHEEMNELENKLQVAETRLKAAETAYKDTEKSCISVAEQIKSVDEQYIQFCKEFDEGKKEKDLLLIGIPDELKNLNIEQQEKEIEKISLDTENKSKAIGEWEVSLQTIQNKMSTVNDQLSTLMVEEKGFKSTLQVNKENHEGIETILKAAIEKHTNALDVLNGFMDKYNLKSAADELKRIHENDIQIQKIQKEIEQQQKLVEENRKRIDAIQIERQKYLDTQTIVETDGKNLRAQKEEKEKRIIELAGECDVLLEIQATEEKINMLAQREKALADIVKALEMQLNNLTVQKNTLESQKDIYSKNLSYEKNSLEFSLKQKGFSDAEDVEKSVLSKEQQILIKTEIEEYEQIQRNLQVQKNIAVKKLNARSITEEQWTFISLEYNSKVTEKEEGISKYQVAKSKYFTTKARHEKWLILNKAYEELTQKTEMLDQIKSLLRGNSFIEYVAEERLRYIVKVASEYLGVMTKYRYILELNADNGFIICDNANGGARRMVSSLSGGETFLTSLSLALALSKQLQLKGQSPLEFFFLDEGFGTLDSNLLDTVIDSLERLSTKERVIGLISHVPELRNRIARRLIVDPPTSDGNGSAIRVEKA